MSEQSQGLGGVIFVVVFGECSDEGVVGEAVGLVGVAEEAAGVGEVAVGEGGEAEELGGG